MFEIPLILAALESPWALTAAGFVASEVIGASKLKDNSVLQILARIMKVVANKILDEEPQVPAAKSTPRRNTLSKSAAKK